MRALPAAASQKSLRRTNFPRSRAPGKRVFSDESSGEKRLLQTAVKLSNLKPDCAGSRLGVMSKSSKQIAINFPNELLDIFEKCLHRKHFRDFVREALAEKLSRDFDKVIPPEYVNRRLGERVDLRNAGEDKLAELRERAAHARLVKAQRRAAKVLPPRRSPGR